MSELRRTALCSLSLSLACIVFWFGWGGRPPGSEALSKHYPSFIAILLVALMVTMMLTLRGRLERAAWPLLIVGLLGYFAASLTYVIYFSLIAPENFANLVQRLSIFDLALFIISLPPLGTMSWLLGALSGAFFVLSRYLILSAGHCSFFEQSP